MQKQLFKNFNANSLFPTKAGSYGRLTTFNLIHILHIILHSPTINYVNAHILLKSVKAGLLCMTNKKF